MCGKPQRMSFRTLLHSDMVCRAYLQREKAVISPAPRACRKSPVFRQGFLASVPRRLQPLWVGSSGSATRRRDQAADIRPMACFGRTPRQPPRTVQQREADAGLKFVDDCHDHALPVDKPLSVPSACSNSSARIGTPRLQACTPWTTQSFSTSMISSIVAPALRAALM